MSTEEARALYSQRKELMEPAFGILKDQMGARRFLLGGLCNVGAQNQRGVVQLAGKAYEYRIKNHNLATPPWGFLDSVTRAALHWKCRD
jgi:hypothetical protein